VRRVAGRGRAVVPARVAPHTGSPTAFAPADHARASGKHMVAPATAPATTPIRAFHCGRRPASGQANAPRTRPRSRCTTPADTAETATCHCQPCSPAPARARAPPAPTTAGRGRGSPRPRRRRAPPKRSPLAAPAAPTPITTAARSASANHPNPLHYNGFHPCVGRQDTRHADMPITIDLPSVEVVSRSRRLVDASSLPQAAVQRRDAVTELLVDGWASMGKAVTATMRVHCRCGTMHGGLAWKQKAPV
jgi:hypothetical protein